MPQEPPPTRWVLPDVDQVPAALLAEDLVGVGGDLEPGTLLAAYRMGLFPMHVALDPADTAAGEPGPLEIGWWSPEPRGVLPLDRLVVSRSLRQSCRRLTTTTDRDFAGVIDGCAATRSTGNWINDEIRAAYLRLHALGWAHSIETWEDGRLVGGLYGVSIGGFFAGESMFHRVRDASKVALVRLVDELSADRVQRLLDIQWVTEHLASLGAVAVSRASYRRHLEGAVRLPAPPIWATS